MQKHTTQDSSKPQSLRDLTILRLMLSQPFLLITLHHARLTEHDAKLLISSAPALRARIDTLAQAVTSLRKSGHLKTSCLRSASAVLNQVAEDTNQMSFESLGNSLNKTQQAVSLIVACHVELQAITLTRIFRRLLKTTGTIPLEDDVFLLTRHYMSADTFLLLSSPLSKRLEAEDREFRNCDEETRCLYLFTLSLLAAKVRHNEQYVFEVIVKLRSYDAAANPDGPSVTFGMYLLGTETDRVHKLLGLPTPVKRNRPFVGIRAYFLFITGMSLLAALLLFVVSQRQINIHPISVLVLSFLFLPLSDFCNNTVDVWIYATVAKRVLPRIVTKSDSPARGRTLVAVPTVLSSVSHVKMLLRLCEHNFLNNFDSRIRFVILSDWKQAVHSEPSADDSQLLQCLVDGVASLNSKYSTGGANTFLILHRDRSWVESEGSWLGYDRKRGKILLLNDLLLGRRHTGQLFGAKPMELAGTSNVMLIDDNTILPEDVLAKLIGNTLHSLNMRSANAVSSSHGFSIFQPFPCVLAKALRSWGVLRILIESQCDRFNVNMPVRNLQFDSFMQCAFYGKGFYDVVGFDEAIRDKLPANRFLSHDIMEGGLAATAYVADVSLPEFGPSDIRDFFLRAHRWMRGDWQNLHYLVHSVIQPDTAAPRFDYFSIFTVIYFCRRDLLPVCELCAVMLALNVGLFSKVILLLILLRMLPDYMHALNQIFDACRAGILGGNVIGATWRLGRAHLRFLLQFLLLPLRASLAVDAAIRACYRTLSMRRILEWRVTTLGHAHSRKIDFVDIYSSLGTGIICSVVAVSYGPVIGRSVLIGLWLVGALLYCHNTLHAKIDFAEPWL